MQPLRPALLLRRAPASRRGAALMMAFLVIIVIILIVGQISRATSTGSRVGRNEEVLLSMDLAIESVLLQVYEDLADDAAAAGSGDGGAAGTVNALASGAAPGGGEEGEGSQASDSREDEWARPQRTELNGIQLRILIQDEDSKFNLLSILTEDEKEAEKAFERLVRVIDFARQGTEADIDGGQARTMAQEILEYMTARRDQVLPKPPMLTDDEEDEERGLLLTLRELVALDGFVNDDFRDFRDLRGEVVHSLGSFLTVWSSLETEEERDAPPSTGAGSTQPQGESEGPDDGQSGDEQPEGGDPQGDAGDAGQAGGTNPAGGAPAPESVAGAVNVNTAPLAVLRALFDDRDVPARFWADLLEYRNTEDDEVEENEDPPLDEYGEEIVVRQFFDSVAELGEVDSWNDIDPLIQSELQGLVGTESHVFSIYVTARKPTGTESDAPPPSDKQELLEQEESGQGLVRTVRSVVWRRSSGEGEVSIVPIQRWEEVDYVPLEVQDYPDEDR